MDAQADLGLSCPHMPKDTLLHGSGHVVSHITHYKIQFRLLLIHVFYFTCNIGKMRPKSSGSKLYPYFVPAKERKGCVKPVD